MKPKQQLFVYEYLIDMNASKAAQRAGYAKSTAQKKAYLWVGKSRFSCPENMHHVWDAVQCAISKRNERLQVNADMVLHELVKMLDVSICSAFDPKTNKLKSIADIHPSVMNCFRTIRISKNGFSITMVSKLDILTAIGNHTQVNAFRHVPENHMPNDMAEQLLRASKRVRKRDEDLIN